VSTSSQYYYADVEELLTEVFGQGTRHSCDGREERVARAGGVRDRLRACIASGSPTPGSPPVLARSSTS
jgi:hypothetical protein